jgi:hypothetical protein
LPSTGFTVGGSHRSIDTKPVLYNPFFKIWFSCILTHIFALHTKVLIPRTRLFLQNKKIELKFSYIHTLHHLLLTESAFSWPKIQRTQATVRRNVRRNLVQPVAGAELYVSHSNKGSVLQLSVIIITFGIANNWRWKLSKCWKHSKLEGLYLSSIYIYIYIYIYIRICVCVYICQMSIRPSVHIPLGDKILQNPYFWCYMHVFHSKLISSPILSSIAKGMETWRK